MRKTQGLSLTIFDNHGEPLAGLEPALGVPAPTIPGVFITNALGLMLADATQNGPVLVSLSVTAVPEPGSLSLLAAGLAYMAWNLKNRIA